MTQNQQERPCAVLLLPILPAPNKNKGSDRLFTCCRGVHLEHFVCSENGAIRGWSTTTALMTTVRNRKFTLVGAAVLDRWFFIYITFVIYLWAHLPIVNASSVSVPCSNCGYLLIIQWCKKLNINGQFIKGLDFFSLQLIKLRNGTRRRL